MKITLKHESVLKAEEPDLKFDFYREGKTAKVQYAKDRNITVVKIPSKVQFDDEIYSVTKIGEEAFRGCANLTSIVIPNSVTEIGDYAFRYCTSLTSIEIPNSVTEIGRRAFWVCSKLKTARVPVSLKGKVESNFPKTCEIEYY